MSEPRHNRNSEKRLREIVSHVHEQLRFVSHAPSVQSQIIPPDLGGIRDDVEARLKEENEERNDGLRRIREEGLGQAMEL
jgi:histone deacetylase HOS2